MQHFYIGLENNQSMDDDTTWSLVGTFYLEMEKSSEYDGFLHILNDVLQPIGMSSKPIESLFLGSGYIGWSFPIQSFFAKRGQLEGLSKPLWKQLLNLTKMALACDGERKRFIIVVKPKKGALAYGCNVDSRVQSWSN